MFLSCLLAFARFEKPIPQRRQAEPGAPMTASPPAPPPSSSSISSLFCIRKSVANMLMGFTFLKPSDWRICGALLLRWFLFCDDEDNILELGSTNSPSSSSLSSSSSSSSSSPPARNCVGSSSMFTVTGPESSSSFEVLWLWLRLGLRF